MSRAGGSRSRGVRLATALLALLAGSGIASAQEARGYVGGSLSQFPVDTHDASRGSPSTSYDNASTESLARGVTAEAGWFVRKSLAIGFEVTLPFRRNDLTSVRAYSSLPGSIASRYREEVMFAVLRASVGPASRVRAAFVGGGGLVFGSSLERYASVLHPGGSQQFGPFSDEESVSGTMLGVTGGADVTIQASKHVAVVPQVRLAWIARGPIGNSPFAHFGLPTLTSRIGIGVRATF